MASTLFGGMKLIEGLGGFVPGGGPIPCSIAAVGEAPGRNEDRQRRCFVGEAGQELNHYLAKHAGLSRSGVYVTNVVKQRPPDNRTPKDWEIDHWSPYLVEELSQVKPDLVLALGATAMRWFLGPDSSVEALHGIPQSSDRLGYAVTVIVLYHPAAGIHDFEQIPLIVRDFQAVRAYLDGKCLIQEVETPQNVLMDDNDTIYYVIKNFNHGFLGIDTEGSVEDPICLSAAVDGELGMVVLDEHEVAKQALQKAILELGLRIGMHNAPHDLQVLEAMGIMVPDELIEDTMVGSFVLRNQPIGLKPLSYRRFGVKMRDYMDVVRPYTVRQMKEYLSTVASLDFHVELPVIGKKGKVLKRTESALIPFEDRLAILEPIVGLSDAAWDYAVALERGYGGRHKVTETKALRTKEKTVQPIHKKAAKILADCEAKPDTDVVHRWKSIPAVERGPVENLIGPMPRADLRDVYAEDRTTFVDYSGTDAVMTVHHMDYQDPLVREIPCYRMDVEVLPMVARMEKIGMRVDRGKLAALDSSWEKELLDLQENIVAMVGPSWFRSFETELNLCSRDQVADLLFRCLNLTPSGRKTKGKKRHVVDGAVLEAIALDHPVIPMLQSFAELMKLRGTYSQGILKLLPDDDRLHPNIRFTRIPSGRFACTEPNLLAIPTRTKLGRLIRESFSPGPGRVLGTVDLQAIEMRVAAHVSNDPTMVRFMNLDIDPETGKTPDLHRFTAAQILGKRQDEVTKDERTIFKTVGFGILYQITESGLLDTLKGFGVLKIGDSNLTVEDCGRFIEQWFGVFQGVKRWVEDTKRFIETNGYAVDIFGRRRYGDGVHSTIERVRDATYRALINHVIQSSACGVFKVGLANLWKRQWPSFWEYGYVEPCLPIHDEILLECDEGLWSEVVAPVVQYELSHAVQLRVPVMTSAASAANWGSLDK